MPNQIIMTMGAHCNIYVDEVQQTFLFFIPIGAAILLPQR